MSNGCAKQYRSTRTRAIPLSGHSVRMGLPVHVQTKDSGGCRVLWGIKEECPNRVLWNWGTFWELCFGLRITRDDSAVLGSLQYPMPENYPNINLLVLNPKRKRPNFPNFMGKLWGNFAHRARPLYSRTFEGGKRQYAPRESQV